MWFAMAAKLKVLGVFIGVSERDGMYMHLYARAMKGRRAETWERGRRHWI